MGRGLANESASPQKLGFIYMLRGDNGQFQALYNLSDDQAEYQLRDRLSFMRFLGLELEDAVPDAKWLYREGREL
jgi:hypothetical protein